MANLIQLTVTTDTDDVHAVAIEPGATVQQLCDLLSVYTGVDATQQVLLFNGRPLADRQQRLDAAGVRNDDLVVLTRAARRHAGPPPDNVASSAGQQNAMRLLPDGSAADPAAFQNALRSDRALTASMDPVVQRRLLGTVDELQSTLRQLHAQRQAAAADERRRLELLSADPFDVDAQRRIEEEIRTAAVHEAYELAMENTPEVFARVSMLYVHMHVNGHAVKAFIDSGAESSFMSRACADACGLLRLMDTRFAGIAKGVGSQKTLGRVHSTNIKVGNSFLQCAITILEDLPFDFLFGLDMLRRHQCCIDLKRNALVLGSSNEAVSFLSEAECPKSMDAITDAPQAGGSQPSAPPAAAPPQSPAHHQPAAQQQPQQPQQPADAVSQLVALGFSAQQAAEALAVCNGNVEQAASYLFSSGF